MKLLTTLFVATFAVFASSAQAASKSDVWELLQRIDSELRHYDQSPRELHLARQKLEEALLILRGHDGGANPEDCREFAYAEYMKDGYSNSRSLDLARDFCNKVNVSGLTVNVVKFFFTNLKKDGYSTSIALDNTLSIARGVMERDLPCLETALGRYRKDGYGMRLALQKSVTYCSSPGR